MLGTARYASPEQATGVQLDARSDLYSLALVLVESVTGRVPFAADTTIGMLTARTQRPLIAPEALGPLAAVIDRAGCVQPGDRYPDAGTMRQALADVAETLAPPGPLVLAGMVDQHDPHPTRVAAPAKPPLFDQDAASMPQPSTRGETARPARGRDPERPTGKRIPGQRRLVPFVVAAVLLATVALAASAFARVSGATTLSVPGFVGRSEATAESLARRDGLTYSVSQQVSPDPKDVVVGQSPAAGSWTAARHVRLVVSTGPALVPVPRITGESWAKAKHQLDTIGFSYAPPTAAYNATFAANTVSAVTPPPGTRVAPDAALAIVVSKGFAPVIVPDVSGQPYNAAAAALAAQHLRPQRANDAFSADVQRGLVISTVPVAHQSVPYNSVVQIVVSRGPVLVKVPDLTSLTLTQAQVVIDDTHGLGIAINGSEHGNDVVIGQTPSPGAMVPLATTTVTLTFGPAPSH
jgi:beta-lactam-binding protein with PASTA domain